MKLRTWRAEHKVLLEPLAAFLKMSPGALSALERGRTWPNPDLIDSIDNATAGQVTEADLKRTWYETHPDRKPVCDAGFLNVQAQG